jgi:hypothetical protein
MQTKAIKFKYLKICNRNKIANILRLKRNTDNSIIQNRKNKLRNAFKGKNLYYISRQKHLL